MKEIFLNTNQIGCGKPLKDFIVEESSGCDVFCFQEVPRSQVEFLKNSLPNFELAVAHKRNNEDCEYGLTTFFNRSLLLKESGTLLEDDTVGFAIWTRLNINDSDLTIVNFHGVPRPGNKKDNTIRLKQSEMLLEFLSHIEGPKIIGGDFNLDIDTKSVKMIEEARYRNLIREFGIKSTRNTLAWEKFKHVPGYVKQYFADFCFVSPEVKVNNFDVPDIEVSDHLPMFLDFET